MSLLKVRYFSSNLTRLFSSLKVNEYQIPSVKRNPKLRENLLIIKLLNSNEKISDDKWVSARKDLLHNDKDANDLNVDSILIDMCLYNKHIDAAYNYIKFLQRQNIELNFAIILKYLKILSSKNNINEAEKNEIIDLYNHLISKFPTLNKNVGQVCIAALCCTEKWRESEEIIIANYMSANKSIDYSYHCFIAAAFDHDEFDLAWNYMIKKVSYLNPHIKVYESYLKYIDRHAKSTDGKIKYLDKLFQFLSDYDIHLDESVVNLFCEYFERHQIYNYGKSKIHVDGICLNCKTSLKQLVVNQEDFNFLTESVKSKVLLGKDVYLNSTPGEITRFQNFIESTKPYDVVLDGLNAAYCMGRADNNKQFSKMLVEVIKVLLRQEKRIAVIGRKHMLKWPPKDMDFIKRYSHMFLANDLSKDDGFVLHATLSSGINTYFVSQDLMRQHKFILNDEKLKKIFYRWQMTRQIYPFYKSDQGAALVYPPKASPISQKDANGWHLPCLNTKPKKMYKHDFPPMWLCLRNI